MGLRLEATSALAPDDVLEVVRQAAERVNGPGAGDADGTRVVVEGVGAGTLRLGITSGTWVGLLSMTAHATAPDPSSPARLTITVDAVRAEQKRFRRVPAGPERVRGLGPYELFLAQVRAGLLRRDPTAAVAIGDG